MKDIENGSHPIDANKNFPSIKATTANDLVDSSPLLWNKVFSSCQCEEGITMFYEFHDSTIQKEFIYFKSYQFGKRFYTWCVASFITFLFSAYFAIALLDNPSSFLLAIFCFTYLFTIPLLWLLSFVKQRQILLSDHVVCAIENAYMLSTTLSVGLIVIFRALNGPCASIAFLKIWTCAPLMKFKYLAADIPAIVIFIPLLCSITLPSINSLSLLFAYLWAIFVPIFAISYLDAVYAMPWFVVIYIVVVLVHIVISATQIQLFRYFRKIEALQQQRELDAQRQANEMRGLIGKLAHDIRTPLVAFSYGLDTMKTSLIKLEDTWSRNGRGRRGVPPRPPSQAPLNAVPAPLPAAPTRGPSPSQRSTPPVAPPPPPPPQTLRSVAAISDPLVRESLDTWSDALDGLTESYLQVMMILNRCVDYHKLSHGLPLIPNLAPVDLRFLLDAIYSHIQRTLDGGELVIDYPGEGGGDEGYLVTDPSWLQDNLLCLLSNAIRFSSPRCPVLLRVRGYCESVLPSSALSGSEQGAIEDQEQGKRGSPPPAVTAAQPPQSLRREETSGDAESGAEAVCSKRMIKFEVEDFGVGVEDDRVPHLFDPPEGGSERSMGGAGLGLYCLAQRTSALGGSFGIIRKGPHRRHVSTITSDAAVDDQKEQEHQEESEPHGSIFWLTLPWATIPESCRPFNLLPRSHGSGSVKKKRSKSSQDSRDWSIDEEVFKGIPVVDEAKEEGTVQQEEQLVGPPERVMASTHVSDASIEISSYDSDLKGPLLPPSPSVDLTGSSKGAGRSPNSCMRVMIIDDSPLILKMLKMMFIAKGHEVVTTPNGYEGLRLLRNSFEDYRHITTHRSSNTLAREGEASKRSDSKSPYHQPDASREKKWLRYDAILVDIQMPIIDGLETMRQYHLLQDEYRSLSSLPWPVVIAMSANADHAVMEDAYLAGADHFLQKPFDFETFYTTFSATFGKNYQEKISTRDGDV